MVSSADIHLLPFSSLSSANVGDDGAQALAQVMRLNSTLQRMECVFNAVLKLKCLSPRLPSLQGNSIGDAGAMALAEVLQVNGSLERLKCVCLSRPRRISLHLCG